MLSAEGDSDLDEWDAEAPDPDEEPLELIGYGQPPLPVEEESNHH